MTLCAGTCSFDGISNVIALSKPLLQLRPRSDTINTLIHEMIHAFLFLTQNIRRRNQDGKDGHGPSFQAQMHHINKLANSEITIYHTFHDEVDAQRKHVWKCDGICQKWRPYFGVCKRSMNRPPQKADNWFASHQTKCGGTFVKIAGPDRENKKKENKIKSKKSVLPPSSSKNSQNITDFFPKVKPEYTYDSSDDEKENQPEVSAIFRGTGKSLSNNWKAKKSRLIAEFENNMKISKIEKKVEKSGSCQRKKNSQIDDVIII